MKDFQPGDFCTVHVAGVPYPGIVDKNGTLRFERNKIVDELIDQYKKIPHAIDLNKIWHDFLLDKKYTLDEMMELYRLIGMSVFGFWEVFGWDVNVCDKDFDPVEILVNGEPYPEIS